MFDYLKKNLLPNRSEDKNERLPPKASVSFPKEQFIIFALLLLFAAFFLVARLGKTPAVSSTAVALQTTPQVTPYKQFPRVPVEAESAYVYDFNARKVLYSKNENESLPLASLTKIMTVLTAEDILPKEAVVKIGADSLSVEGDSGLIENERWTLGNLADFTLLSSSNDGADAISKNAQKILNERGGERKSFIELMNEKAKSFGMEKTVFQNATGLDINHEKSGAYGSAKDIAMLMRYILKKRRVLIESTQYKSLDLYSLDGVAHKADNTNLAIGTIPHIIGSKTGYTDLAGGNLALAFDAAIGYPIIVIVLGSSQEGRFKDAEALSFAALSYLKE